MNDTKQEKKDRLAFATFILSVAGLLITAMVSATNIYISSLQKDKELTIQSLQKDKELTIQKLKNESDQKLGRGQLIFTNIKQLNSTNEDDKKLAISALVWTLGREDADKLFSNIQLFGPSGIHDEAGSARINIQNANLTRESNVSAWNGNWVYIFKSSSRDYTGSMNLGTNESGRVLGKFDIKDTSIEGSINGELSEDGTILSGSWENTKSQKGNFYYELTRKNNAFVFQGSYSMSDTTPNKESVLTWTGIKKED